MNPTERDRVYADIFNQLGDALIVTDLNGEIIDWNLGAERVFGYTRDEALGRRPSFLFLPEEQDTLDERVLQTIAEQGRWFEEITVVHKDGGLRFCEALVVPVRDDNGVPYLTIGVNRDITRRRETEEDLRLAGEILDHMTESVHLVRRVDLTFVYANRAFHRMFGYAPNEVLGKHVSILSVDDEAGTKPVANRIVGALERRGSWTGEVHNVDSRGRRFWSLTSITSFHHHRYGDVWLAIKRDLTERKRAEAERRLLEEQLIRAQRLEALGTLASGVAHDFNNILQAIVVAAEDARRPSAADEGPTAGPEEATQRSLSTIAQFAGRGRDIVQRILSFAKARPELEPLDLGGLVSQTVAMLRPLLPATVRIETRLPDEPAVVKGDESQLQQVLVNLCTNASFAMRKTGGLLHLEVARLSADASAPRSESFRLTVRDTGEGVPPELAPRIFDPFFTTKERGEGSGLGLSIAHRIVESHQGTITFDSGRDGTRFEIVLPGAGAEPNARADRPAGGASVHRDANHRYHPLAGLRVLFVDDEDELLPIFARALADHGLVVETAHSGEAALELFREGPNRFDFVITDQRMPGMSGTGLSRELAAIRPECPVVVMTGLFGAEEITRTPSVRGRLMKPFSADELLQTLARLVDEPGSK